MSQPDAQEQPDQSPARVTVASEAAVPAMTDEHRWGEPITPERQAELQGLLDTWTAPETDHGDRHGPFAGVALTGADVCWLAQKSGRDTVGQVPHLHLERADLSLAHLEGADLSLAHLEGAVLWQAHLEGATLDRAHLEDAFIYHAQLEGAHLREANLERTICTEAHLERADLVSARLEGAALNAAHLEGAVLLGAQLAGANLREVHLEGAILNAAHLEGTDLRAAHLEGKAVAVEDLERIRRWAEDFPAQLSAADLRGCAFDDTTSLDGASLGAPAHGYVTVADLRWRDVNLAVVSLPPADQLGDERVARTAKATDGKPPDRATRRAEFEAAVRAHRQLAVALQNQGMSEASASFAYRAQLLQQQVLWRQRKVGAYLFSRFLDALAGYGYKPARGLIAYICVVLGFAAAYYLLGPISGHPFYPDGALVFSLTSFHGRGFFPGGLDLENWVTRLAAAEAVIGLLIEISFIATFTQRFFGAK
jgi:uncharacterized protein YjbI with pentapeptide repeats